MKNTPEMQLFYDISTMIMAVLLLTGICLWAVYLWYKDEKTQKLRKEFKEKLTDEHDKALIMEYENQKYTLVKRKKQK